MSPFWAAMIAACTIGETMTSLEITALIISFIGVCLITSAAKGESEGDSEVNPGDNFGLDPKMVQIVGCLFVIVTSVCQAVVAVKTRLMQSLLFSVVLFYYSMMAIFITTTMLGVEHLVTREKPRFFSYTWE